MRSLVIAALLAAGPAMADYVLKTESGYIRLQDAPCTHAKVLDLLRPQFHSEFRHGYLVFKGKQLAACWIFKDGEVTIIDEEGDGGSVPVDAFKKVSGA
jgi:hypothetical protein